MSVPPVIAVSAGFPGYGDYTGLACARPLEAAGALPLQLPYLSDAAAVVVRGGTLLGDAAPHPGGYWDRWDRVRLSVIDGIDPPEHPGHPLRNARWLGVFEAFVSATARRAAPSAAA